MKKNLRFLVVAAAGLVGAVAFSSCAYDPYYTSVGGSYSTGYGTGYGYGGSSFTTDIFVGTGNPRWGYDPYCYSYYDYNRRAYYDPYLNGYYPVGYRPRAVYGVSHPYGWRPGSGYCRPPSRVSNVTISNYHNREAAYRSSGYIRSGGSYNQRPMQGGYNGGSYEGRPSRSSDYLRSSGSYNQRPLQGGPNGGNYEARPPQFIPSNRQMPQVRPPFPPSRQDPGSGSFRTNGTRQAPSYPSRYNSPVTSNAPEFSRESMKEEFNRSQAARQPREMRQLGQPDLSRPPVPQMQVPQPQAPQPQIQQPRPERPQGSQSDRVGGPPQGTESGPGRRGRGPGGG